MTMNQTFTCNHPMEVSCFQQTRETGKSVELIPVQPPAKLVEPEILPPIPKLPSLPKPAPEPVVMSAVKRILRKHVGYVFGFSELTGHKEVRWFTADDGTNCGVFENNKTSVRYVWTLDPKRYDLKCLGPANE